MVRKYILDSDGSQGSPLFEVYYDHRSFLIIKAYRRNGTCEKRYHDANKNSILNYVFPDGTVSVRYEYITNPEGG